MRVSLHKILVKNMLNRRILRIKAFKVLYSSILSENVTLAQAESQLELSCEATRDLYIYMLGIVSPLTKIAQDRIESLKAKFNPTEEERNPNMKFAEGLEEVIAYIKSNCIKETGKKNGGFTDVDFEEL